MLHSSNNARRALVRSIRCRHDRRTTCIATVPTLAHYLHADPRAQAAIRDALAHRHESASCTEFKLDPPSTKKREPKVHMIDPQKNALDRDKVHRNAQYIQLLNGTDELWQIVSITSQALELDARLGHTALRYTDRRLLAQRQKHLTQLHYQSQRQLYKWMHEMRMAY